MSQKAQDKRASTDSADTSGRKQMVSGVVTSWLSQLVFIVAGFVMPRLIDHRLGQEMLGVWDFAWSIIGYFGLVQMGVIGSVNRYVAMHRAAGDMPAVNRAVSSVFCVLWVIAGVITIMAAGTAIAVPHFMSQGVGQHQSEVAWVIFFLGLASATQTAASAHSGVLTGCHKWKLHNAITSAGYAGTVAGMITALLLGYGIKSLGIVYFLGELFPALIRVKLASRVCPGLSVRIANADWKTARGMIGFGSKSFIPQVADLLLNQTLNVLIVGFLGPAALALYSRPRSLVLQARTLVYKMAGVIMPSVSSLHAVGNREQIQDLLIKGTRYAAYLTLPITAAMLILGGPLLSLWMGAKYANPWLMIIFAVGYCSYIIQTPTIAILGGMNMHGRAAIANFVVSIVTVVIVVVVISYLKLGLEAVAIAAVGPLAVFYAWYVPHHACQRLGLSFAKYCRRSLVEPIVTLIPYFVTVAVVRYICAASPLVVVLTGSALGGLVLVPIYWKAVLPESLKLKIKNKLPMISGTPEVKTDSAHPISK